MKANYSSLLIALISSISSVSMATTVQLSDDVNSQVVVNQICQMTQKSNAFSKDEYVIITFVDPQYGIVRVKSYYDDPDNARYEYVRYSYLSCQ